VALSLNGTSQLLEVASVPVITGPLLSMSLWFYPTGATSILTLASIGVDSARYSLRTGNFGGAAATIGAQMINGADNPIVVSGNNYTQNAWNHAFGNFEFNNQRVRLNGGTGVTQVLAASVTPASKTTVGGRYSSGVAGSFFAGRVAEFAVWNALLTSEEEVALSKGISPLLIRPGKRVLYWPLIREGQDLVGSAAPALTGSPSAVDHPLILKR
jgi:hypothetical protein